MVYSEGREGMSDARSIHGQWFERKEEITRLICGVSLLLIREWRRACLALLVARTKKSERFLFFLLCFIFLCNFFFRGPPVLPGFAAREVVLQKSGSASVDWGPPVTRRPFRCSRPQPRAPPRGFARQTWILSISRPWINNSARETEILGCKNQQKYEANVARQQAFVFSQETTVCFAFDPRPNIGLWIRRWSILLVRPFCDNPDPFSVTIFYFVFMISLYMAPDWNMKWMNIWNVDYESTEWNMKWAPSMK
jgi:hypothetical protein